MTKIQKFASIYIVLTNIKIKKETKMSEINHPDRVEDPALAEAMAYAEKPFRDVAVEAQRRADNPYASAARQHDGTIVGAEDVTALKLASQQNTLRAERASNAIRRGEKPPEEVLPIAHAQQLLINDPRTRNAVRELIHKSED